MTLEAVRTKAAPPPGGHFSQAIKAHGFVFCAGYLGRDPLSGEIETDDPGEQTQLVIEHLKTVLEAAGSSLDRVVKTTMFVTNMSNFEVHDAVYRQYFTTETPPARSTVQVAALRRGGLVEIEAIALA
ncbi:MAG: Rid family detoxifying hydrolase [Ardenticatenaceae bacterium]|nr:Rid family detoxifying hydrolase [Ardenticatenaceae bacterium]